MPERLKAVGQHVAIFSLTLFVIQKVARDYLAADMPTSVCADAILCCAIFIGQIEHRPMTAANLADYVGMPRPTVIRRLRTMQDHGLVSIKHRRVTLPADRVINSGLLDTMMSSCGRMNRISAELSKLDSNGVAHIPVPG